MAENAASPAQGEAQAVPLPPGLALADRRSLSAFLAERWPQILAAIREAAGFEVPVEVRWDQIARPGHGDRYGKSEYFSDPIFEPLIAALRDVARDEMGREALRTTLTRIVIRHDPATAPIMDFPEGLAFEGGVLSINWTPGEHPDERAPRVAALVSLLERSL